MNGPKKPEAQADYRVETCAPGDLTAAEMERCTAIIIEGEAIENPESVKTWLPRSVGISTRVRPVAPRLLPTAQSRRKAREKSDPRRGR